MQIVKPSEIFYPTDCCFQSHNAETWLCFDGPATSDWTDYVNHVLGGNQVRWRNMSK